MSGRRSGATLTYAMLAETSSRQAKCRADAQGPQQGITVLWAAIEKRVFAAPSPGGGGTPRTLPKSASSAG
eukprot:2343942-Alexandrium_andersonii.AAC.1